MRQRKGNIRQGLTNARASPAYVQLWLTVLYTFIVDKKFTVSIMGYGSVFSDSIFSVYY